MTRILSISGLFVVCGAVVARAADVASGGEAVRRAWADAVFAGSMVVFAGLLVVLLSRRLAKGGRALLARFEAAPEQVGPFVVSGVEVLSAGTVRVAASTAVVVGVPLVVGLLVLGWVLYGLASFEVTRPVAGRLAAALAEPVVGALAAFGSGLPQLVLFAVFALGLIVVLRVLGAAFGAAARGEQPWPGVDDSEAPAVGFLLRLAVLAGALVFVAPAVIPGGGGVIAWFGAALLAATGLAAVPVLANVAAGLPLLFGRVVVRGDRVRLGADGDVEAGAVEGVRLTATEVSRPDGSKVRIPHLWWLVHPVRVSRGGLPGAWELVMPAGLSAGRVVKAVNAAAAGAGAKGSAALVELDGTTARYVWHGTLAEGQEDLLGALSDALVREGLEFKRLRRVGA